MRGVGVVVQLMHSGGTEASQRIVSFSGSDWGVLLFSNCNVTACTTLSTYMYAFTTYSASPNYKVMCESWIQLRLTVNISQVQEASH